MKIICLSTIYFEKLTKLSGEKCISNVNTSWITWKYGDQANFGCTTLYLVHNSDFRRICYFSSSFNFVPDGAVRD